MGTYRTTWECCGDTTETDAWEPCQCPFCEAHQLRSEVERLRALLREAIPVLVYYEEDKYDRQLVDRLVEGAGP